MKLLGDIDRSLPFSFSQKRNINARIIIQQQGNLTEGHEKQNEDGKLKKQMACQNSVQEAITWRRAMTPVADTPRHNPYYWR